MAEAKRLRILLVGASGTLGRAVAAELGARHDIITAGRNANLRLDLADPATIVAALQQVGRSTRWPRPPAA